MPYNIPSDWKALWFSNLDELQRVNEANDNNTVSNVTVQLGGTAFLHCKVRNLAERTVSDAEVRKREQLCNPPPRRVAETLKRSDRFSTNGSESSRDWSFQPTANSDFTGMIIVPLSVDASFLSRLCVYFVRGDAT